MVVTSEAQTRRLATVKARSPSEKRRVVGMVKSTEKAEHRRRRGLAFKTGMMTS